MAVLVYSVIRYRRRTPDQPPASLVTHNTAIEVTWTVVPLIIVMVIFAWGWKDMSDMLRAPADSLQYEIRGKRWSWGIKHPNSTDWTDNEMWVPLGKPCQLTMSSADVLHSFYIPAFRVKRDVLPGRYQTIWFKPTVESPKDENGKSIGFHLFCTEYCGTSHSAMIGRVHVVSQAEFDAKPWDVWSDDPKVNGEKIYKNKCKTCHNTDATRLVGPGFAGIWDRSQKQHAADLAADSEAAKAKVAEYLQTSIRNPNDYIVPGFENVGMTPFTEAELDDEKLGWVIEYLKTLK
jgi:cytochrome c oxidase subunit 2